ncbi:hypothetical protein [Paraburkholderia caffeinilytica]|uniref:hypothetical protein n=1 Tax=Paraburkholderia caffeinilytica TaxID=1761016 RepID=UPI0013BEA9C4|nr:hypothetical protein [Paraburkholderia caffeinilytica]
MEDRETKIRGDVEIIRSRTVLKADSLHQDFRFACRNREQEHGAMLGSAAEMTAIEGER